MTVIHDGLAGCGQILLRNLVKPPAPLHHQARPAQTGEVLGRIVIAATGDFCHFINRSRFARAQFLEHFPAVVWPSALASRSKSGKGVPMAVFGGSVVEFMRNSLFHWKIKCKKERAIQ
jgi:hypothetical protein